MKNIKVADLYYDKSVLGSDILNFSGLENDEVHHEIVVSIRAVRKGNILNPAIEKIEEFFTNTNTVVTKMRVKGYDHLDRERSFITDKNRKSKIVLVNVNEETNEIQSTHMFRILREEIEAFSQ